MYATDWSEVVPDDEEASFARFAEVLGAIQVARDTRYGEKARTLHRAAHAGVEITFSVRDDLTTVLPEPLHVGPFRPGATYAGFARFSNGGMDRVPKDVPDVRGVALKLLGVPGPKALGDAPTQDFLLNHGSTQATRTPTEFLALVEAASQGGPLGTFFRLGNAVGYGRAFGILRGTLARFQVPFGGFANETFTSMVPFRFGPTAARYSLVADDVKPTSRPTLATELRSRLAAGASWTFRVQLYQDPTRTPIEDPTVDWDAPWIEVASVVVAPVDLAQDRATRVAAYVERLAFDPWHAHEELRPVGAFNRARKAAYFLGSAQRREAIADALVVPVE